MGFTLSTGRQEGICGDVAAAGYRLDALFYWFHMRILKFLVTEREIAGVQHTPSTHKHTHTRFIFFYAYLAF